LKLACVGCNWKTPIKLRERLAIPERELADWLQNVKSLGPEWECVALSTCNRTEIYVAVENEQGFGVETLFDFLARDRQIHLTELLSTAYVHEDAGAALHLFHVAAGLDSLVLGEVQILGQTRDAYQAALNAKTAGPLLHPLFQRAFAVAKRVQNETTLTKGKLSIASAAIEFIQGVFDSLVDKTVLVIGAGKMAELALTHLKEHRPKKILLCNRTWEHAEQMAQRWGGEVRPFSELARAIVDADIIVSSTGASQPIVRECDFRLVHPLRRGRHLAIIDIAVPRDFDDTCGQFDNVFLWNIDHLERIRHQTLRSRERALDHALRIVDEELASYERTVRVQKAGPLLAQLEDDLDQLIERELDWLHLSGDPTTDREKVRHFAHRLKNKFLHRPRTAVRQDAQNGEPGSLMDALRRLFHLT
jgi:glutamyl-tRNA reductase